MSCLFSPDSLVPTGDCTPSSSSAASRRICRALVVEAIAHEEGVTSTLYCKVVLPTASRSSSSPSTSTPSHLLHLLPSSSFTRSIVHPLPLQPGDPPGAVHAARVLGLTAAEGGPSSSVGRRGSLSLARMQLRREADVREGEKGDVGVVLLPFDDEDEGDGDDEGDGMTKRAPSRAGTVSPTFSAGGGLRSGKGTAEFLVVLEVETRFGRLRLPEFANTVLIPTPLCLRNTLSFSLPSPPSSSPSSSWDLSVRPSLSNASSSSPAEEPTSSAITGTFPTSPSLSLRWTPQLPAGVEAPLVLPKVLLDVNWAIEEDGSGKVEVEVRGSFVGAALREKQWVELEVGVGREGTDRDTFEVVEVDSEEDTPVLTWETAEAAPSPASFPASPHSAPARPLLGASVSSFHPTAPPELDDFSSPLDDSLLSDSTASFTSAPFTPTPTSCRRPPSSRASEPRPPSFTSLFDTAPPAALQPQPPEEVSLLDLSLTSPSRPGEAERGRSRKERQKGSEGSSLLGQEAPFDPEASGMDMSFEVGSESGSEEGDEQEEEEAEQGVVQKREEEGRKATRLRVQLDLAPALRRSADLSSTVEGDERPSFAFALHLFFPASTLSGASASSDADAFRVFLPAFAIPSAQHEETVVSVSAFPLFASSAEPKRRVELLPTSLPPYRTSAFSFPSEDEPPPSPLPGTGGRARWSTVRGGGAGASRTRKISGPVEVEVVRAEEIRPPSPSPPAAAAPPYEVTNDSPAPSPLPSPPAIALPADDLALPLPPMSAASTSSFVSSSRSSPSSSDSPRELPTSIALVSAQVTPVPPPPSSPGAWRVFYRLSFDHPLFLPFFLPHADVKIEGAWSAGGETVEIGTEEEGEKGLRVVSKRRKGVKELLYVEEKHGEEDGKVILEDALPVFGVKVARMDVGVAVPQGYCLDSSASTFELVSPSATSTTFTRFLLSPDSPSPLGIALLPKTPPYPSLIPPPAVRSKAIFRSLLASILHLAFIAFFSSFGFHLGTRLYHYRNPPSSSVSSPVLATTVFRTHTHFITSFSTVTSTETTTATSTSTSITTALSVVTTTHLATITSTATSTTTSTNTVTHFLPSPSSPLSSSPSPSSFPVFSDVLPPPSPPKPSPSPSPSFALDLDSTARSAVEAFRLWSERVKYSVREGGRECERWWKGVVGRLKGWVR
ncbi:hypothetical protein JCM8547_000898 [Rhodosporidiobolus lusitaniae]